MGRAHSHILVVAACFFRCGEAAEAGRLLALKASLA